MSYKRSVLVAEDSPMVNSHICALLEDSGITTFSASNGKEAMQKAQDQQPDLVLMDIKMDGSSDGLNAAEKITNSLNIPIIFLTAMSDDQTIQRAMSSSPYGYILKPFDEVELLTNVQVVIARSITERKLNKNQELFSKLLNSLNIYLVATNAEGKIAYLSPALEAKAGHAKSMYGKPLSKQLSFTDLETDNPIAISDLSSESFYNLKIKNQNLKIGNFQKSSFQDEEDHNHYDVFLFADASDKISNLVLENKLQQQEMHQIIEGQEAERTRIATELHDSLGQILNTLKLAISFDNKDEANELVNMAIEENRRISDNLLPKRIIDLELDKSLQTLADKLNEQSPKVNVSLKIIDKPRAFKENDKIHVYRIVQEATHNALRHSGCQNLTIQIMENKAKMILSIEDDGTGFDQTASRIKSGSGLLNIDYRAKILGGSVSFESAPGKGTFVYVEIPNQKDHGSVVN